MTRTWAVDRHQLWAHCHRAALEAGLEESSTLLHTAIAADTVPCGPGGHAFVPASVARQARLAWVHGRVAIRSAGTETSLGTWDVDGLRFCALRHIGVPPWDGAPAPYRDWLLGLAWLRLGLSERLLRHCMTYLSQRATGEGPLLFQQMIKNTLAEAAIWHLQIQSTMSSTTAAAARALLVEVHRYITAADHELVQLLGASGFTADSLGHVAYISELLADPHTGRIPQSR
jgi:hypothetical protein